MSLVVAMDTIEPKIRAGRPDVSATTLFRATIDTPNSPTALQNRYGPGRVSRAHFHICDQFQIIMDGKGKFGRKDVSPYCVQFARAYTPYGPLVADQETGWAFLLLRSRYDPGAQHVPAAKDKLKEVPDRRPWQIMKKVAFPPRGPGVSLQYDPDIKDDQGLFVCSLVMAPQTQTTAPDPSTGDGQYVVVLKGSLMHDDKEYPARTVVFVKPADGAFQIHAGAQGLEGLILNLPQVKRRPGNAKTPATTAGFKKWQCELCSFAYDEALGLPEDGIPAGTRWEDVPDTWTCPDCSASKSDFQMVEVQ